MKKLVVLLFLSGVLANAQNRQQQDIPKDSIRKSLRPAFKEPNATDSLSIKDYKIISHSRDTTYIDTALTIRKHYKHNYLRKDNFGLLRFSNIGQTYNTLAYDFDEVKQYPNIGMTAKHFNYMEVEDISYFEVPTVTTEVMYKSAFEQGQMLDALITMNTSRQLNVFLAYKGLRSLGKYQNILTSTGNFRFGASYNSKNGRYLFRGHITAQDITNQENGGLTPQALTNFLSGEEEFIDRSRLSVRFQDATSLLDGKRYYFDHSYALLNKKDANSYSNIAVGHTFRYETKFYEYEQTRANGYFGESFIPTNLKDRAQLRSMFNELSVSYATKTFGDVKIKANNYFYNYFFKDVIINNGIVQPNQLSDSDIAIGGSWKHQIAGLNVMADASSTVIGDIGGNYFKGGAGYKFSDDIEVAASISTSTRSPNFNFLLYQSDYTSYNWENDFNKEKVQNVTLDIKSDKWLNASVAYSVLDDRAYFGLTPQATADTVVVAPKQFGGTINHLKIKLQKEFRYGKFALDNTILYQNVSQSENILNVPKLMTRNSLYYTNKLFKKALFLQTGVTFNYFSKYYANAYNPLIGEFYIQDTREIGDFPRLDFFVNAKIKRTRIFLKAEHFNSNFTGYNFFSAPDYPYRDFIVRFGVVWNFFK
ncbi:putative porin [Sungkyunkwania multivorans]|uniref:Porin n=1 Tax=Sungkyunkwania multivorans TaxID=1173618 RepID=A0ABW3CUU4_9FLAO